MKKLISAAVAFAMMLSTVSFATTGNDKVIEEHNVEATIRGAIEDPLMNKGETSPNVIYDYKIVYTPNQDTGTAELTLDIPESEAMSHIQVTGSVLVANLAEDITIMEGSLRGEQYIDGEQYVVLAALQKRVGHPGICVGITIYPDGNPDESKFFSFGKSVYTEEVKAAHPLFNAQQASAYVSPEDSGLTTKYAKVDDGSEDVSRNAVGLSGKGITLGSYYKKAGISFEENGEDKDYNVLLFTVQTNVEELRAKFQTIATSLFRFQRVGIEVKSSNPYGKLDCFAHTPPTKKGINLYDILSDALSSAGVPMASTIMNALKAAIPPDYEALINVAGTESNFAFSASSLADAYVFDKTPIAVDYCLKGTAGVSYGFSATATVEYYAVTERGDSYLIPTKPVVNTFNVVIY